MLFCSWPGKTPTLRQMAALTVLWRLPVTHRHVRSVDVSAQSPGGAFCSLQIHRLRRMPQTCLIVNTLILLYLQNKKCVPVCVDHSLVHLLQNTLRPQKNCNRIVLNGFVFSNYLKTTYTKSTKIESAIAA